MTFGEAGQEIQLRFLKKASDQSSARSSMFESTAVEKLLKPKARQGGLVHQQKIKEVDKNVENPKPSVNRNENLMKHSEETSNF